MARFTAALLKLATTNLRELAIALKADVNEESNYRRIRRFLSGYAVDFTMLGRLLVRLLPETPPYKVVLDRTEWHFGRTPVNVLMVGIAHKGVAFPVSWTVRPSGGSSSADDQCRALRRFFAVVDPSAVSVVLADREFISAKWLRWLQPRDIPFVVRLRSDRRVGLTPEGPSLPARMFARPLRVGAERVLGGERYIFGADEKPAQVRVVCRRIAPASRETGDASGETGNQFLILATWGIDPEKGTALYRRRWEIETLFGAAGSRGYRLEETHLTGPDRLQRVGTGLLLDPPCRRAASHSRGSASHEVGGGRRQRSLFRYGLDLLRGILTTPEPQPAAFFDCLRGLRSPTAFLSCT
jgi:hypothetical protein